MKTRAELFRYVDLDVSADTLTAIYELDDRTFVETVTFEGVKSLEAPAVVALAQLWYLVAGLSYYKAGAARRIDVGTTPLGTQGRRLLKAALSDGLGEFAYRNQLPLSDVTIEGRTGVEPYAPFLDATRVLTPFGGGIDSVVTVEQLRDHVDQSLFVVSPAGGRFAPLEATAAVTGLDVIRASRTLDPQIVRGDDSFFNGHVPVTTMITLLAAVAAVASGHGGVALSNEQSSSVANLRWYNSDINHQWSKSWNAEHLIASAIAERVGDELVVASYLRDRSELWVADVFSKLEQYHHVFRSCNRAFTQAPGGRATQWCGECDKCLFVNLVLAPFLARAQLRDIFSSEPLSNPALANQLRTLVGLGAEHKPFECVGDPDESAVALTAVSRHEEWRDVSALRDLADELGTEQEVDDLLEPQGSSRVPAHWLR
jgi:UDP-N-acetyl-alpha-D-muramoyl-L-alanyl-L-glutamate epimerase